MSPEDVPAELVEKAAAVLRDSGLINVCGDDRGCQCEDAVEYSQAAAHDMLAAVLPLAEAKAWSRGYAASDYEAYHLGTHGRTDNPYREGSQS